MWSAARKGFIERSLISTVHVKLQLHADAVESLSIKRFEAFFLNYVFLNLKEV